MAVAIRRCWILFSTLLLSACDRLTAVPFQPHTTPAEWLEQRPYWQLGDLLMITEPSSSLLIFGLALYAAWIGHRIWRRRVGSPAHWWWGMALLLWGLQAALAGIHYQAFSYEVRCAGYELCRQFSWFEINYYLVTMLNINAMVVGVAFTSAVGRLRRALMIYAAVSTVVYFGLCLSGAFMPNAFLVSFELLVMFTTPTYLLLFAVNLLAHRSTARVMDMRMMQAWGLLFVVTAGYFVYAAAGIGEWLWARGIWFNANDFLHAGLIGWMVFIHLLLEPRLQTKSDDRAWVDGTL